MKVGRLSTVMAILFFCSIPITSATGPDGDSDGFPDEQDGCPNISGNSTEDRLGCPDYDDDGWSDPDDNWVGDDGADMFWRNPSQHADSDNDGWGDSSVRGATQVDYWPQIQSKHVAVLTLGCSPSTVYLDAGRNATVTCSIGNPTPQNLYLTIDVSVGTSITIGSFNESLHLLPSGSSMDRADLIISISSKQTVADTVKITGFGSDGLEMRNITIPVRPQEDDPSFGAGLVDDAVGGALSDATNLVEAAGGELKKFTLNQRIVGFSIGVLFLLILSFVARRSRHRHIPGAHTRFKDSRRNRKKRRVAIKDTGGLPRTVYPQTEIKRTRSYPPASFEPSNPGSSLQSKSSALEWVPSDD